MLLIPLLISARLVLFVLFVRDFRQSFSAAYASAFLQKQRAEKHEKRVVLANVRLAGIQSTARAMIWASSIARSSARGRWELKSARNRDRNPKVRTSHPNVACCNHVVTNVVTNVVTSAWMQERVTCGNEPVR